MSELLDFTARMHRQHANVSAAIDRKARGQVFTPAEIAEFMAGLFSDFPRHYRLLDPGAGVGTLTAAVAARFLKLRSPRTLEAHCFENDPSLLASLHATLKHCQQVLQRAGHTLEYYVHATDFITDQSSCFDEQKSLFGSEVRTRFDGVIMNPPYFKVRKDSRHAKLMAHVVHGQPNVYALFLMLAAGLLNEGGELVAITPRSFCNGLYFRQFRHRFFGRVKLDHIHLFESRTDAFKESGVLQESVVTKTRRCSTQSSMVTVTSTFGRDMRSINRVEVAAGDVIDSSNGDLFIRILVSDEEREIMEQVEALPMRFSELGLRISTGPVVLFRATQFLLDSCENRQSVPLLMPHNIKCFDTVWPRTQKKKPVAFRMCDESARLVIPTANYVLVKRFSAKEERRRLVASCVLAREMSASHLAIENHLNYIYLPGRGLTEDEAFGIAGVLNSSIVDRYFRTISGNTQVNATEMRAMRFPSLDMLRTIGNRLRKIGKGRSLQCDAIVLDQLGIQGDLRAALLCEACER